MLKNRPCGGHNRIKFYIAIDTLTKNDSNAGLKFYNAYNILHRYSSTNDIFDLHNLLQFRCEY